MTDPKEALERLKSSLSKEFHGLGHMRTSVASDDLRVLIAEREGLEAMHRDMCGVAGRAIERAEAAEAQREGLEREVAQQKHENDRLHEVIAGIISTDAGNRAALEAAESKFSALSDKAENVCIAHGMAWDMEGVIGELRALLHPAVPVETKGSVSSTKGGGEYSEDQCSVGLQATPVSPSPSLANEPATPSEDR